MVIGLVVIGGGLRALDWPRIGEEEENEPKDFLVTQSETNNSPNSNNSWFRRSTANLSNLANWEIEVALKDLLTT